jgi:hypothetical protein
MSCNAMIGLDRFRLPPRGQGRTGLLPLNKTQVVLAREKAEKTVGWHPTGFATNLYD